MGREPTVPLAIFLLTSTKKPVTFDAVKLELLMNVSELKDRVAELHQIAQNTLDKNRFIGEKMPEV